MDILQRALREALHRNGAETVRWTQYKEQHEGAKANIEEFKKSLEVDIMVPIGSKALMPGRLYHTNEIVVCHSGTYYSECSAHKALEICENRINVGASRLKDLEAEANLHRNQLELPLDFDAFSSQEIIETYDEEEEKQWQADHKKKMKEHKRKEAMERQKLMNGKGDEDDIIKKLEELELMEELENELEAISEEDDEAVQAILNGRIEESSHKKRITHFNERDSENVSSSIENVGNTENDSLSSNSADDDDDDDDIPAEFKELEQKTASMPNKEKLKLFKVKFDEVQDYLQNCRPRTIEEISNKTDGMFLSDHLLNAIETIQDELNCDRYLNGENVITEDSDAVIPTSVPKQTKTILKKNKKISSPFEDDDELFDSSVEPSFTKRISFASVVRVKLYNVLDEPSKLFTETNTFASNYEIESCDSSLPSEDEVESFDSREEPKTVTFASEDEDKTIEEPITTETISFVSEAKDESFDSLEVPNKLSTKKISFALVDDVMSFDVLEEPSRISSTVIYDHGPVLNLNVNHSEAVFSETSEQSDVIRSPVDIYKQFAGCTLVETKKVPKGRLVKTNKNALFSGIKGQPINEPSSLGINELPINQPSPQEIKEESRDKDLAEAKTEVKEMLDNMFLIKNPNEPDPLPEGSFVDAHEPKKRVSLFKQRRQMKSQ